MSWSETKKINSDLTTPLNKLIDTSKADIQTSITSQTTTLNNAITGQTTTLNTAITNARKYLCLKPVTFSNLLSAGTTGNVLNVTGPGVFNYLYMSAMASSMSFRILLDNVIYYTGTVSISSGNGTTNQILSNTGVTTYPPNQPLIASLYSRSYGNSNSYDGNDFNTELNLHFKNSLVITLSSAVSGSNCRLAGRYCLYSQT